MINNHFPTIFGALVLLVGLAAPANTAEVAAPDPTATREFSAKLLVCGACHGTNGVPQRPTIPIIWGQDENYLLKQLHDFRSKTRDFEVMKWMSETLTDAELTAAIGYFTKQPWPAKRADAAATPAPRGIAVCQACHGPTYTGARQAEGMATPRLAGQSYEYLVESMRRFADGERKNNDTMAQLMAGIPPADREAMARYLSGL